MAAVMKDIDLFLQAGVNPNTGLPIKMEFDKELKANIKKNLRVLDEQNAVRRYKWYNLPDGIETVIERVLYYKGQGMFFYFDEAKQFYFLPFTLNGNIDIYGRFTAVSPLPFNGSTTEEEKKGDRIRFKYLMDKKYKPIYSVQLEEITDINMLQESCVILGDYSKQISQTVVPRQILNDPILDVMANCIPFMNTSIQNSTGTLGMRVNNQDEYVNVLNANKSVKHAALEGDKYVPIIGSVEFQEMTGSNISKPSDFMQALESLDNFRLGLYGIENGGLFQKKAHMLESEQGMAGGATGLVYQDGLTLRQQFCNIVNSIWGLGIGCEASETEIGDMNMDGFQEDEEDQNTESEGVTPVEGGESNE